MHYLNGIFKKFILASTIGASLLSGVLMADTGITRVSTDQAPKAIGPYSQAIRSGSNLYVSGQIGIDPTTGKMAGATIEAQTKQVLANIAAILASQGLTLENVVKTTVYMIDLKEFSIMNGVYAEQFSHDIKPARATVQVSKLPLDAIVEIECIATFPE